MLLHSFSCATVHTMDEPDRYDTFGSTKFRRSACNRPVARRRMLFSSSGRSSTNLLYSFPGLATPIVACSHLRLTLTGSRPGFYPLNRQASCKNGCGNLENTGIESDRHSRISAYVLG